MMAWSEDLAMGLALLTLGLAVGSVWLWRRWRQTADTLLRAERDLETGRAEHATLQQRLEQQRQKLEDKQREAQELKRELGAQRKKNHAAQQETKSLRQEMRDSLRQRQTAQAARPAFEPEKQATPPPTPAPQQPQPVTGEPAPKEDSSERQRAQQEAREVAVQQLEQRLERVQEQLTRTNEQARDAKRAATRQRELAEKLRRVDLISKNRIELLEDKLKALGRAYYEAVSELAVLKGEVQPPPPVEMTLPAFSREDGADEPAPGTVPPTEIAEHAAVAVSD